MSVIPPKVVAARSTNEDRIMANIVGEHARRIRELSESTGHSYIAIVGFLLDAGLRAHEQEVARKGA